MSAEVTEVKAADVKLELDDKSAPKAADVFSSRVSLLELAALDMPEVNPLDNDTLEPSLYEYSKLYFFGPLFLLPKLSVSISRFCLNST